MSAYNMCTYTRLVRGNGKNKGELKIEENNQWGEGQEDKNKINTISEDCWQGIIKFTVLIIFLF